MQPVANRTVHIFVVFNCWFILYYLHCIYFICIFPCAATVIE